MAHAVLQNFRRRTLLLNLRAGAPSAARPVLITRGRQEKCENFAVEASEARCFFY